MPQAHFIISRCVACFLSEKPRKGALMAIAELSIIPIGTKSTSLSSYVAACLKVLKDTGLTYEVHGMGTIIEGDLKDIFDVVLKMHEVPFQAGALRVVTTVKIDDRRDKEASAKSKVEAVLEKTS
jgi:uncharacterized protein (TIGR00106 family)